MHLSATGSAMEGISLILGGLALAIALAALWFVNDVTHRVEEQNRHFFDNHIKGINETLDRLQERVAKLERSRVDSDKLMQAAIQESATVVERTQNLEALVRDTRDRLEHLDDSIEPRYRKSGGGRAEKT